MRNSYMSTPYIATHYFPDKWAIIIEQNLLSYISKQTLMEVTNSGATTKRRL